jgi:stalled ribosome rescue protein Dom34
MELHHNDRFKQQLNKYYQQVLSALKNADAILLMGPGEAKIEFEKAVKKNKGMQNRILKVETADKMTKNQMLAHVREFYESQSVPS